jgi:hypothetical protein
MAVLKAVATVILYGDGMTGVAVWEATTGAVYAVVVAGGW